MPDGLTAQAPSGPERLLVTHEGCLDGTTAALLWTRAFPDQPIWYTDPGSVGEATREAVAKRHPKTVWLVDVSAAWDDLAALGLPVTVIDHHETARDLAGRPGVTWDVGRCGSYLLWQRLVADGFDLAAYEPLVTWVDDRDRWLKQDPRGDDLATLYSVLGRPWYLLRFREPPSADEPFTPEERAILAHLNDRWERRRRRALEHAVTLTDAAGRTVRGGFAEGNTSDLGNLLASEEGVDYALLYNPHTQAASLRGTGKVNLAHFAESLGGGGHPNAAGFTAPDPAALTRALLMELLVQAANRPTREAAGPISRP